MAQGIFIGNPGKLVRMDDHVRPRAYDRHVAHQYVEKLGQFVKAGFAQKCADAGYTFIIVHGRHFIGLCTDAHASEFITFEKTSVFPGSQLDKEYRSFGFKPDQYGKYRA
jgi:hypothetical protein